VINGGVSNNGVPKCTEVWLSPALGEAVRHRRSATEKLVRMPA